MGCPIAQKMRKCVDAANFRGRLRALRETQLDSDAKPDRALDRYGFEVYPTLCSRVCHLRIVPKRAGCKEQGSDRSREARGIPRLSALSLCGASPRRRPGEPDQTMDGPFAELDGPPRRAITARHGLSSRMVRELGFELGELGYKLGAPIRPSLVE